MRTVGIISIIRHAILINSLWAPGLTFRQGLGTSKDEDGRAYFRNMQKHMIPFTPAQPHDQAMIDLAFSKKKADERKEWLRQFKVLFSIFYYIVCS